MAKAQQTAKASDRPRASELKAASRRDDVYRQILAMITDGSLTEGDRLPSEAELADRFGVSRPTLREALMRLRDAGVILVRQGAGSFVQGTKVAWNDEPSLGMQSLREVRQCMEFRAILEGEA